MGELSSSCSSSSSLLKVAWRLLCRQIQDTGKGSHPCRLAVYAFRRHRIVMNSSADPSYPRSIPSHSVLELKIGSLSLFPHTTLIMLFFQRVLGSDTFGRQHRCLAVTDSPKTLPSCRRWATVSNCQTMQVFLLRAALTTRPLSVTLYRQTLVDKPEPESPNKFANCQKKTHLSDVYICQTASFTTKQTLLLRASPQ